MKSWEKYQGLLMTGNWHVHSNYTDGQDSVLRMCDAAVGARLPLLAFTEHVRKELSYDFDAFLSDLKSVRAAFPEIVILSGCEAKILPGGDIDAPPELIKTVDYPIVSFHSFEGGRDEYLEALKKAVNVPEVCAWGHPGALAEKRAFEFSDEELNEVFGIMAKNKVLLESNEKYGVPKKDWEDLAVNAGVSLVRGRDSHSTGDI